MIPAVLCLVCFGCNNKGNSDNQSQQETSADWAITTKVKASIMSDSSLSASARLVSVSTTDGVVTLSGNVPYQADAERLVKIAKKVDGVKSVDNQLVVTGS